MARKRIIVSPEGQIYGLWSDMMAGCGDARIRRASHVEYDNALGCWMVTIIETKEVLPGPYCGGFRTRKEALQAESDYFAAMDAETLLFFACRG